MSDAPQRDAIDQFAAYWYAAEREADPAAWEGISLTDCIEVARDRVLRVFDGEVRWSEATPGDRAVWQGRPRRRERYNEVRSPDTTPAARAVARPAGRYRTRTWWNFYDTVRVEPKHNGYDQYGNKHADPMALAFGWGKQRPEGRAGRNITNLNGPLCAGYTFVVFDMYAVPVGPLSLIPWDRVWLYLQNDGPRTPVLPLAEVFLGIPLAPPVVLSRRRAEVVQLAPTPTVRVDWKLGQAFESFDLVVHLEGLVTNDVAPADATQQLYQGIFGGDF